MQRWFCYGNMGFAEGIRYNGIDALEGIINKRAFKAMVSKPGLSNSHEYFIRLKPPPIPVKNFTDDKASKEWLSKYR